MRLQAALFAAAVAIGILAFGTPLRAQDTDGDSIPDSIENQSWYQAAGGSPTVKDVWVECDFMPGSVKKRGQLRKRARNVFAKAPVEGGIALHLVMDKSVPFEQQWGDIATQQGFVEMWNRARDTMDGNFNGRPFGGANADTMKPYMHYCIFVNAIDADGVSGFSMGSQVPSVGIPGDLFVVALGQYKGQVPGRILRRAEVGTFLHELGHNLGLTHGGANPQRHATYKPNYLSVMNYHHQFGFYRLQGTSGVQQFNYWDYSRAGSDNVVHEKRLKEGDGITLAPEAEFADTPAGDRILGFTFCEDGGSLPFLFNAPIDYDCDGRISSGRVKVDTNLDGRKTKLGRATTDWDRLDFRGVQAAAGATVRRPILSPQSPEVEELDRELIYWMLETRRNLRLRPVAD